MISQPFYTSKGFWSSLLGAGTLIYYMAKTENWNPELVSAAVLAVLSNVFRWSADQPLSTPGRGVKRHTRRHLDGLIGRLTKD